MTCLEEKLNNIQLSLELLPDMLTRYSVSVSQCQGGFHGAINHFFLKTATDGTLRNHLYKILQLEKWNLNLLKSDQDFIFGNPGFYKIKP